MAAVHVAAKVAALLDFQTTLLSTIILLNRTLNTG